MHWPVVTSVSQATRALGSLARIASRMASEIWSATLSGWPIETDSLVNRCVLRRNWEDTLFRLRGKGKNAGCGAPFGAAQAGRKIVADAGPRRKMLQRNGIISRHAARGLGKRAKTRDRDAPSGGVAGVAFVWGITRPRAGGGV